MPVDYSQFLEPEPSPAPTPAPSPSPTPGPVDYSQFLEAEAPVAPSGQGRRFIESLMIQDPAVAPAPQDGQVIESRDEYEAAKADWASRLASQGPISPDGGPNSNLVPEQFPTYDVWRQKRQLEAGVDNRPSRGMAGAFAADLTSGLSRLGSMVSRGQLAPDHALEAEIAAKEAQFAPRTMPEKIFGGLGGSVPALATIAATRGRTMPAVTGSMAVPLEVGGASFVQGMSDPNKTPAQNLSSAMIEALMTRAGGTFEPGFGSSAAQLPAQLAKEGLEEGVTGSLQNLSDQVNDPEAVASGAPIDWSQFLEAGMIGAGAGSLAAAGMAPLSMASARGAQALQAPAAEPAPLPEDVTATQTDLRPVDVQAIEAELARGEGIPDWVDDETRQEIVNRFRPDERSQIPGLDVTDFKDPAHLQRLQGEVRDYLDRAKSESDIDQYNAVQSTLNEVPDAAPAPRNRITAQPSEFEADPGVEFVGESGYNENMVKPEFAETGTRIDPAIAIPATKGADTELQAGRIVIPAKQEPYGVRDVKIKPGVTKTPTAELRGFLSPKGIVAYNSLSELERQSPEIQSTIQALRNNPDPNGDAGNIVMARDIVRSRRIKPKAERPASRLEGRPEPAQQFNVEDPQSAINFQEKQGEYRSPEPATEAGRSKFPATRGAIKGEAAVRKHLGPALGKAVPAPAGFAAQPVRVFKDAGQHTMKVKMAGQYGVAWDEHRGKAIVITKTDEKGRAKPDGQELRPVDAQGKPTTISEQQEVPRFESVEDAARFIGRSLTAAKPAAEPVAPGVQDAAVKPKDNAEDRVKVLHAKMAKGGLTDEEVDELERLEEAEREEEKRTRPEEDDIDPDLFARNDVQANPRLNSPLTPKTRGEIADSIDEDTPADAVGKVVQNLLDAQLKREATFKEVRAALADLEDKGIITSEQAKAKLERGFTAGANFAVQAANLAQRMGKKPSELIQEMLSDLNDDAQLVVRQHDAIPKGHYGSTSRKVARAVTRVLGSSGIPGLKWLNGPGGKAIADWAMRLNHLLGAQVIAARFTAFRPILDLAKRQIDNTRIAFMKAYNRLGSFRALDGEYTDMSTDRGKVNGALIQFRLEDRKPADFDKPVTYTDSQGRDHAYTLTPEQIKVVKDVFGANRKLMEGYVKVMLHVLQLPPNSTSKTVAAGVASGALPKSAEAVVRPLEILEQNADNYIPLKRFGDFMKATVYDPTTGKMIKFIKAENLADYRKQVYDILEANPGAKIDAVEEIETDETDPILTQAQLAALAEAAGVPAASLQNFLASGVGDYFATRGLRARFAESRNIAGFSHDMLRANAHHAKQMTEAIMRMAHRSAMESKLKGVKDDKLLKEYAQRFIERQDTPIPPLAGTIRSLTTLFYLGFAPVTALINSSSSLVFAPAVAFFATGDPLRAAKVFGQAARRQFDALAHIFGAGKVTGKSQAEMAAKSYEKDDPKLAMAIRQAEAAGVFADTYDREAERVAMKGERGSKIKERITDAYMHFFSKVETANRLSAFVAAYNMYPESSKSKRFNEVVDNLGFHGNTAYQFAEWFSDFNNFRMDKTDMPSWAQGTFKKDASGKQVFTPSTWRPMAYALKSWSVNYLQQQALILRAALKGGLIDKALYAAIAASFIAMFGAVNIIPGMQSADEVAKVFSKDLEKPSEKLAQSGALGRGFATGVPGMLAAEMDAEREGKYIDQLVARTGPGNVIPSNLDSLLAPLGVANAVGGNLEKVASGDTPRQLEGIAGMLGKEAGRLSEVYNMATGSRGKTSKTGNTVVGVEGQVPEGVPSMDMADLAAYGAGLQPPVLETAYRMRKMSEDMRTSNDRQFALVVNTYVDGVLEKDASKREKALKDLAEWNKAAVESEQYYKLITADALMQGIQLEIIQRKLGSKNLRQVPTLGRGRYLQELEERNLDDGTGTDQDEP